MNVFSAFNGIGCGFVALDRVGIKVNKYYVSEIDQRANTINSKNWPKTIYFGDISKIKAEHFLSPIDLMMGGSPCQDLSIAGKMAGLAGKRSGLFYEFIRLKNELNPTYFFFENVRMKKSEEDKITALLGVEPIYFDSALVSTQTRKRLYWTNIISKDDFVYPEDRGIVLNDILEFSDTEKGKSYTIDANYYKGSTIAGINGRNDTQADRRSCIKVGHNDNAFESASRIYSPLGKAPCIHTQAGGGQEIKVANVRIAGVNHLPNGNIRLYQNDIKKSSVSEIGTICHPDNKLNACIASHVPKVITHSSQPRNGKGQGGKGHLQKDDGKSYCIDTTCTTMVEYSDTYRKLTPIEVERCFSLPDNYTKGVSQSARYHGLGNGWEVATVVEFFKHLPSSHARQTNL